MTEVFGTSVNFNIHDCNKYATFPGKFTIKEKANKNKGTLVKHAEFFSMFWGEMLKIIIRQIRHRTMVRSFLEAIADHFG